MATLPACSSTALATSSIARFNVILQPEIVGKSTTISVDFGVAAPGGGLPSPLTSFDVSLPAGMGLAGTTLGIDACSAKTLMDDGASGCPPDAAMGSGSAMAEAALGSEILREPGRVLAFMTQARDNNTTMLYYFDGRSPVIAPLVFPSELVSNGYSPISELVTAVPLIPALPGTPDAAIVSMHVSLGPRNLTYYRRVGKRVVRYKPVGMAVPATCPRGGFLFSGRFAFADGTRLSVAKRVACP